MTLEMKRFKAATHHLGFAHPSDFGGDLISIKARIFLEFVSMPLWLTMYPKNLSEATLNVYLRCIGLTMYFRRI